MHDAREEPDMLPILKSRKIKYFRACVPEHSQHKGCIYPSVALTAHSCVSETLLRKAQSQVKELHKTSNRRGANW